MPPNDKYDVFVEGVRDGSQQGIAKAAQALAPRLSMPAERVVKLLAGRFRVRTGVDEEMGRKLARDLEAYGLRAVVVPQGARATIPASRPAPAPPAPAPTSRSTIPAARPAPAPSMDDDGGISIGGMPALEPQGFMPSSFGPPAEVENAPPLEIDRPAPRAASPRPLPAPAANPFAPPESAADHAIDLAVAAPKPRATGVPRTGTQPPAAAASQSQRLAATRAADRASRATARALRGGLVVLVLAVAIGWFPAHLYAQHVDQTKVVELQKEYRQLEVNPWKGEPTRRTKEKVREEINEIRWHAMLLMAGIWAACAGLLAALAYVLF